jgi:hypothetical protein
VTLQTCAPENFRSYRWEDELTVKRAQTVSEDPHRHERKFKTSFDWKYSLGYDNFFVCEQMNEQAGLSRATFKISFKISYELPL